uniref:diphosphoinositol-polyphosphate diphosphatase n=1 Tax=Syphacia muris TaxID=451379 RepID=A0A158R4C9_9BILA
MGEEDFDGSILRYDSAVNVIDVWIAANLCDINMKKNGERQLDGQGFRLRAAGICTRLEGSRLQILLVSCSKDEHIWVIPGGGIEVNEDEQSAALREVLEEAGVVGKIVKRVGEFKDEERRHRTAVFILSVIEELREWEDGYCGRKRQWMTIEEGIKRVKASQTVILKHIMNGFDQYASTKPLV